VHTIRPGSPMEGLVFVDDIIIAVNNINTREYTAEQITQIMKDTVGQERKITVLSAHR
jgi:C-terminal processing protease CtpA/Prc